MCHLDLGVPRIMLTDDDLSRVQMKTWKKRFKTDTHKRGIYCPQMAANIGVVASFLTEFPYLSVADILMPL